MYLQRQHSYDSEILMLMVMKIKIISERIIALYMMIPMWMMTTVRNITIKHSIHDDNNDDDYSDKRNISNVDDNDLTIKHNIIN